MGKFRKWCEAKQFAPEDIEALGHQQDSYVYHYDKKYDWHVYFANDPKKPLPAGQFATLVKNDKAMVRKFFDIVYSLFEVAEDTEARASVRRKAVSDTLVIPLLMLYKSEAGDVGYYRANTPDLPNPVKTTTNYVEIIRTPKMLTQNIVRHMVHEFGHAIYHAIDCPQLLRVIYDYVRRETRKYAGRDDVNKWWSLGRGKKVDDPKSNLPTDYSRWNFYRPGFYATHESGSEWLSDVLANLVINDKLQQPFLRFIRTQLRNMIQFGDDDQIVRQPGYRPNMFPDDMQPEIARHRKLADMGAFFFR